jgi:hypothetical protein
MNKGLIHISIVYTPLLLIINLGLGSQQEPITIAGIAINQIINWIVILGMTIIVVNAFGKNLWTLILISGLIGAKLFMQVFGETFELYVIYKICLLTLSMLGGFVYLSRHFDLIYKQVLILSLLNLIMMVLQTANAGDWTQFLSTESTFKYGEKITHDTLFVQISQLKYSVIQARPSGLLRSNNILSGVIIFALALHFSREKSNIRWGSIVLCAMIVFAGARVVYVSYILIIIVILYRGSIAQKKNIKTSLVILLIFETSYYFFFPGLFINYWQFDSFFYNFFIRINDIISAMDKNNILRILLEGFFSNTATADWNTPDSNLSGFTVLVKYVPYLLPILLMMIPIYVKALRKQNSMFPHLKWVTVLCLLNFILYPAAVSIFLDQFYWFTGGFALSPLILLLPLRNLFNSHNNNYKSKIDNPIQKIFP